MRKTIIFGALAALIGLTTLAQASDDDAAPGARQVAQERASDGSYRDHDRYERRDHARDMRDHDDDDDDGHDRYENRERSHGDRD